METERGFSIMAHSWTIGSQPDCDLVVASSRVSGRHCRLTLDANGYVLEDLGSTVTLRVGMWFRTMQGMSARKAPVRG
jgi:pSer/pThr/pTyr-binding forkhead associated (FHA) protein